MGSLADATPQIALGALDGRYRAVVAPLVDHLSEAALNRERVAVEVEWLIHLADRGAVPGVRALVDAEKAQLRDVVFHFGPADVTELAEIERETVHDVKAVEYYLKRRLARIAPQEPGLSELVHFCCTSEDVNNLAYALMIRGAITRVWLPKAVGLVTQIAEMARDLADVPLLAHTHGQPATPPTLGKELAVLAHRLRRQLRRIAAQEYLGKINGATGTYGAHLAAVPDADWPEISRAFVEEVLGLSDRAYQNALRYARERLQMRALTGPKFPDKPADPIIVHPDVRRMLLTQKALVEGGRLLAYHAFLNVDIARLGADEATRNDADALVGFLTPIVKACLTEWGIECTYDALQCYGGHGYIVEHGMEQLARDARITLSLIHI